MCSIDVRAFHLKRRSNRVFDGKRHLSATVGLERHHEQYRWLQRFIRRKYRIWTKSGNIHSGTWTKFYRNIWSDASIVLYIQCGIVFVKVSLENRRWNKNITEGSATYIQSKKSCLLDVKLHIKFIAFSYFLLRYFMWVALQTLLKI